MSIPSNDWQQVLLKAVWRWHLQRQRPETPEEFVVAGLATCSPRLLRRRYGLSQGDFWPRVGIEQSGGSRYEGGRALPDPLRILLSAWD